MDGLNSNKSIKSLLVILFIIAIIPALLSILFITPHPPLASDQLDFHQIAIGLIEGRGFHSNFTPAGIIKMPNARHPLYPFFIAVVYFFTNNTVIAVKILQILMHGLICIIIFLISEKLFKNKLIGFGAGIAWALYPLAILQSTRLMSETLFIFLLAMSVLSLLRNWENPNLKNGFLSGLFLGLAVLTKSVVLVFIPFLFLWMILFSRYKLVLKLKNFSIIILFIILTTSPWLIRNYIVLKHFFPIATGGGLSFYRYNNEKVLDVINTPMRVAFPFTEQQKKKISTLTEPEIDKYLYRLGRQFIKSHPGDFFKIRLTELCFFWHLWPSGPKRFTEYYSMRQQDATIPRVFTDRISSRFRKDSYLLYFCKILYHMPYNVLFLGMFISFINSFKGDREQWKKSLMLFLLIIVINAVYVFHHGTDRYRIPIDPYVFILGMHGVTSFYYGLKRRRK